MNLLERIPAHALTVDFALAGNSDAFGDGLIHQKVAPCTIIAQAVEGRYEIETGGSAVITEPCGAFLATGGEGLGITHHGPGGKRPMRARWLHAHFLLHGTVDFVTFLALPRTIRAGQSAPFGELILELLELQGREATFRDTVRRNELALRALSLLCDLSAPSQAGMALLAKADRLTPVLTFIRAHLGEPLTIDLLAKAAGLSRSRLHALFHSHLDLPPLSYVKRLRIAQASRMLLLSDASIKEIAEQCGFANPYHFSREFKAGKGQPPLHYRRQHQDLQV
jgi:AraC-like DNA-binding protein